MKEKKMRYVDTLTSSNTSADDIRLRPGVDNAIQVTGTVGGVTALTVQLGNKDSAGVIQYGDVEGNNFTGTFATKITVQAEFAKVTATGADGSTDLDVFATTL